MDASGRGAGNNDPRQTSMSPSSSEAIKNGPGIRGAAGSTSAGTASEAPAEAVRYLLEGIDIVGNTKTRRQVVEHYVPFRRGDVLDVDDPKLELTRYRLLGTGFFRDVQLSLRKGSARGRVILVVEVTERNTLVVTDLAVLGFETEKRRMQVISLNPGVSREQVQDNTGFRLDFAAHLGVTEPPTAAPNPMYSSPEYPAIALTKIQAP